MSTSVSFGTILGKQEESCLGAQYAIAPSSSTDPVHEVHKKKEKKKTKHKTKHSIKKRYEKMNTFASNSNLQVV